jgi:PleD family two-component response regulator
MTHKPFKVLIVDDEPDMAENLERMHRETAMRS